MTLPENPGPGGSLACAATHTGVAFAYVPNRMGDERVSGLFEAARGCLQ
jgi:hypothetical protein